MFRLALIICGIFLVANVASAGNWQLDSCTFVIEHDVLEGNLDIPQAVNNSNVDASNEYTQDSTTTNDAETHHEGTAIRQATVTFHWSFVGGGTTLPLGTHNNLWVDAGVPGSTGLAEGKITGGSRDVDSGNADPTHHWKGDSLTDNKSFGNNSTTVTFSYGVYTFAWNATENDITNEANASLSSYGS